MRQEEDGDQRNRIRTDVGVAAVQDSFVAPAVFTDTCQRPDDPQPKLLALLILVDGNVLDVANAAKPAEELALDEDGADSDDTVGVLVDNDDSVVGARCGTACLELRAPRFLAWVRDDGED